ncbi:PadR family transcriptional regulator [Actinomadura kijaniata]|uniref:PadR family transcriptional regulator n=1 Tax=Actinomadura kijaniata TaxID=46161 RepID=UPI00082F7FFF|nr:PadR family transcriptional regulator [Actinomadura kijaniata]
MARPLTPLALTVLRMLFEGPMHPYEMQQQIRVRAYDQAVKLTHGALYSTVDRLAANGLIEPLETSREGRRPERTVYAITERGRDAAQDRLAELLARPEVEFPLFGTALALIIMMEPGAALIHLRTRAVVLQSQVAAEQTAYDALIKRGLERPKMLDQELKIAQLRTELDYITGLVEDLAAGRLDWTPGDSSSCIDRPETPRKKTS